MTSLRKWQFRTKPTHPARFSQVSTDPTTHPPSLWRNLLFMKREWVFQTVNMRTPLKRSFKILQYCQDYLYYFQGGGW